MRDYQNGPMGSAPKGSSARGADGEDVERVERARGGGWRRVTCVEFLVCNKTRCKNLI